MHVKPVRYQNQRCLHFITFSCYHRMPLLDPLAAKQTFEQTLTGDPDPSPQQCHPERGLIFARQAQRSTAVEGSLPPVQNDECGKAFSEAPAPHPRSLWYQGKIKGWATRPHN